MIQTVKMNFKKKENMVMIIMNKIIMRMKIYKTRILTMKKKNKLYHQQTYTMKYHDSINIK